jgi:hypothetical protein
MYTDLRMFDLVTDYYFTLIHTHTYMHTISEDRERFNREIDRKIYRQTHIQTD